MLVICNRLLWIIVHSLLCRYLENVCFSGPVFRLCSRSQGFASRSWAYVIPCCLAKSLKLAMGVVTVISL